MVETERRAGPFESFAENERRVSGTSSVPSSPDDVNLSAQRSLFVDNARFWSMLAIVVLHSFRVVPTGIGAVAETHVIKLVIESLKFSSIDFFLISGFLLGPTFEVGSRASFLRRRLKKVLLPWLAWFTLAVAVLLAGGLLHHRLHLSVSLRSLHILSSEALGTLTGSSYWFVPNLFGSTCVLLLFRKYLNSLWLGGSLLALTLFYGLNIYGEWIPTSHTTAVGGYIFFLWLGNICFQNYRWLSIRLNEVSLLSVLLIASGLILIAVLESAYIQKHTLSDPLNTLRISNQLYSVAVAALFMKMKSSTWPKIVDARTDLFGIYLIHWIIVFRLQKPAQLIYTHLPTVFESRSEVASLIWVMILTISVFSLSLGCTKLIRSSTFGWLVGDLSLRKVSSIVMTEREQDKFSIAGKKENEAVGLA